MPIFIVDQQGVHHPRTGDGKTHYRRSDLNARKGDSYLLYSRLHSFAPLGSALNSPQTRPRRRGPALSPTPAPRLPAPDVTWCRHSLTQPASPCLRRLLWDSIADGRSSQVAWSGHAVADLALGENVGRTGRVIAQLAAEPLHVGVHQPMVAGFPPVPDLA